MNNFMIKLKAFLLVMGSNPIVAWLVRQATTCGSAYIVSHPFTPTGWQAWALNGVVFVVSGVVHAFDIWLSQQVANNNGPRNQTLAPGQPPQSHMEMLKAKLKMVVLLIGVGMLLTSSSYANDWTVGGKAFGFKTSVNASLTDTSSGMHLVSLPTNAVGFGVGPGPAAYGYTGGYDLLLTNVSSNGNGGANLSPIFGAGVAAFIDVAPWINSSLSQPVQAQLGFNILGPDLAMLGSTLGDVVPSLNYVWELDNGNKTITFNLIGVFKGSFLDSLVTDLVKF